ncbi:bifunctional Thioredoxin domain/DnaJ domain/Chaperone J-domain superfamily/DnaJ domain [Babesia duncani]|nr:bifunctional Thioredoxin domain/DnaJ domain/Chaperone J-domain superfamily/DnaJ domain [Babesia duncani]
MVLLHICGVLGADYYQILGVSRNATVKEIEKAFRRKAKELHPDQNPGKEAEFSQVANAYEVLKDPEKREQYDRYGEDAFKDGHARSDGHGGGGQYYEYHNIDDTIFDQFFQGFNFGGDGGRGGSFQFRTNNNRKPKATFKDTPIREIKEKEYEGTKKSMRVLNVYFCYMDTCGYCRESIPEIIALSQRFKDAIEVFAINCNENSSFCSQHRITAVPHLFAFNSTAKQQKLVYQHDGMGHLDAWISNILPSKLTLLSTYDAFTDFCKQSTKPLKLVAVVKKSVQLSRLKALSSQLEAKADIAYIKSSNKALVNRFGTEARTETSVLFQVDGNGNLGEFYYNGQDIIGDSILIGNMEYSDILLKLSLLFYEANQAKYSMLTREKLLEGECNGSDNQFCFILVKYGHSLEAGLDTTLTEFAKRYGNDPVKIRFVHADQMESFISAFGMSSSCSFYKTCTRLLVYRAKRGVYKIMEQVPTREGMENFINDIITGSTRLVEKTRHKPIIDEL